MPVRRIRRQEEQQQTKMLKATVIYAVKKKQAIRSDACRVLEPRRLSNEHYTK